MADFLVLIVQTGGVFLDRTGSESRDVEGGWNNMEPHGARPFCPCLVLISLERQRWPCWVTASTSRAAGLDSWPWSGRWEVTREVGVGSAYVGLQRASKRGKTCMWLSCREIGKQCLPLQLFQWVCGLSLCKCIWWRTEPPVANAVLQCQGVMLGCVQTVVSMCTFLFVGRCMFVLTAIWHVISPAERADDPQ